MLRIDKEVIFIDNDLLETTNLQLVLYQTEIRIWFNTMISRENIVVLRVVGMRKKNTTSLPIDTNG